jgi:lipopolysaccharide assembly protein B
MTDTALLGVSLAALAGVAAGRLWASARLRAGRGEHVSERASRHLFRGLQLLTTGHSDLAVGAFLKVRRNHPDSVGVALALGNLLRESGQVERAIQVHQAVLDRIDLTRREQADALECLGMDSLKAGFIDRATQAFRNVLEIDPRNISAWTGLAKIQEDERRWLDAYHSRARLARLRKADASTVLAYLQAEIGREAAHAGDAAAAERALRQALRLSRQVVPAYLGLADLRAGSDVRAAIAVLEDLVATLPERAYHAFERLAPLYAAVSEPQRFTALCERLIQQDPHDWRARLALARALRSDGRPREAIGLLTRALEVNPHALVVHLEMLRALHDLGLGGPLLTQYVALAETTLIYADPHVCSVCHYRAGEILWRCPHCHEWGTMVEERVAPTDARR